MEGRGNITFFFTQVEEEQFVRHPSEDAKLIFDYISLELRQEA